MNDDTAPTVTGSRIKSSKHSTHSQDEAVARSSGRRARCQPPRAGAWRRRARRRAPFLALRPSAGWALWRSPPATAARLRLSGALVARPAPPRGSAARGAVGQRLHGGRVDRSWRSYDDGAISSVERAQRLGPPALVLRPPRRSTGFRSERLNCSPPSESKASGGRIPPVLLALPRPGDATRGH
jgi:hypothetical protein